MNRNGLMRNLLLVATAVGLAHAAASSDDQAATLGFGAIHGVTLDTALQPLTMVRVSIQRVDGNFTCSVVSDRNGLFVAEHLTPGTYSITAAKEGKATPGALSVVIAKDQTTRPRVVLAAATAAPAAAEITLKDNLVQFSAGIGRIQLAHRAA